MSLTTQGDFAPASALVVDSFSVASDSGEIGYERTFDLSEVNADFTVDGVVVVQNGIGSISPNGEYGRPPRRRARSTRTRPRRRRPRRCSEPAARRG